MAWLHATPKLPEGVKGVAPKLSRIDQFKKDKVTPKMPPNPAPHIIGWLVEIGLTEAAGMGAGPISWQSLDAWCNRTKLRIAPWEARLLRHLSVTYLAEGKPAEAIDCPPPWRANITAQDHAAEIAALDLVLG